MQVHPLAAAPCLYCNTQPQSLYAWQLAAWNNTLQSTFVCTGLLWYNCGITTHAFHSQAHLQRADLVSSKSLISTGLCSTHWLAWASRAWLRWQVVTGCAGAHRTLGRGMVLPGASSFRAAASLPQLLWRAHSCPRLLMPSTLWSCVGLVSCGSAGQVVLCGTLQPCMQLPAHVMPYSAGCLPRVPYGPWLVRAWSCPALPCHDKRQTHAL